MHTGQNIHTFSKPIYDPSTPDPKTNKKEQYKFWTKSDITDFWLPATFQGN